MAAAPKYKVFDADGSYQASCKEPEAAASLMSFYGDGATIRLGHESKWTAWTEGKDGEAGESFDHVAETVRIQELKWSYPYRQYQMATS